MKLYNIDIDYVNYLREFESIILKVDDEKEKRPFVGVVLNIRNLEYYAPLTHIQKTKNKFTDFNLYDKNGIPLGCIKINNMIPVSNKKLLKEIETKIKADDSIKDIKYKKMIKKQLKYIDNNIDSFNKKVNKIYKIGIGRNKQRFINNFTLLEEKSKLYIPEFYIYQDREQGKLVVFNEEKKDERYNLYGKVEVPKEQIGVVRDLRQLSDLTTFALIDENNKNKLFYSTISKKIYETIERLNEEVQSITQ